MNFFKSKFTLCLIKHVFLTLLIILLSLITVGKKCAVISSYLPQPGDLRTDTVSDEEDTETFEKYETYIKMIGLDPNNLPEKVYIHKRIDDFEKEKKRLLKKNQKI